MSDDDWGSVDWSSDLDEWDGDAEALQRQVDARRQHPSATYVLRTGEAGEAVQHTLITHSGVPVAIVKREGAQWFAGAVYSPEWVGPFEDEQSATDATVEIDLELRRVLAEALTDLAAKWAAARSVVPDAG